MPPKHALQPGRPRPATLAGRVTPTTAPAPTTDVGSGMGVVAAANGVLALAGVVTLPLLAVVLGVDGRGQVAAGTAPLLLATVGMTLGLPEALTYVSVKHPQLTLRALRRTRNSILLVGAAGSVLMATLARWLAPDDAQTRHLIVLAGLALAPTLMVAVLRAAAAARQRWRLVAGEQCVTAAGRLLALVALAAMGTLTPTTATLVIAASPVLGGFVYLRLRGRLVAPVAPAAMSPEDPPASIGWMYGYGLRTWIGSISGILLSRLDQTLMTPLASVRQLGLYAVAASISEVTLVINNAVRDVTFATDAGDPSPDRLTASARISSALSLLVGLLVGAVLPILVPPLFGDGYRASIPSTWLLIAAMAIGTPGSVAGAALSARGHPGLRSAALTFACVVNLVGIFLLVPAHGAVGAAIATVVGATLAGTGNVILLWRVTGIRPRSFYGLRRSDLRIVRSALDRLAARVGRRPPRRVPVSVGSQ